MLGGSVAVSWALMEEPGRRDIIIEWVERNGPAVRPPTRRGFGTQLLERVLSNQIGARAMIAYDPEGLRAHLAVPLPHCVAAPGPMDSRARP